jgi:hypothetical protein
VGRKAIAPAVSGLSVDPDADAIAEFLNSELIPLLKRLREVVSFLATQQPLEAVVPFGNQLPSRPSALSATFQDADTVHSAALRRVSAFFDPSTYVDFLPDGRARGIYLTTVVSSSGANTVDFDLYDVAAAHSLVTWHATGTTLVHASLGPIELLDGLREYRVRGRDPGATDYALVHDAYFSVLYA